MLDRRNLLKFFGSGALVAPIIGQAADESNAARLIEPARVEGVELFSNIPATIEVQEIKTMTLVFNMRDGKSHRMNLTPQHRLSYGTVEPSTAVVDLDFRSTNISPMTADAVILANRR